jgi:hypothetical protein
LYTTLSLTLFYTLSHSYIHVVYPQFNSALGVLWTEVDPDNKGYASIAKARKALDDWTSLSKVEHKGPSAAAIKAEIEIAIDCINVIIRGTRCPGMHELTSFKTPCYGYGCDLCKQTFDTNTIMFGCRTCDWDSCSNCHIVNRSKEDGDATDRGMCTQDVCVCITTCALCVYLFASGSVSVCVSASVCVIV